MKGPSFEIGVVIVPLTVMTSQMLPMTPTTSLIDWGGSDSVLERAYARTGRLAAERGGNLGEATVRLGRVKRGTYSGDSRRPLEAKEGA
jgi:hypothetical protein